MSIRTVHILFIVASVGMSVIMTAWFLTAYRNDASTSHLAGAILSAAAGVALLAYGTRFRHKTQGIDHSDMRGAG